MAQAKNKATKKHIEAIHNVIIAAGNQQILAKMIGIGSGSVSAWHTGTQIIPLNHAEKIEKLFKNRFTVLQLRPDIKVYEKYFINKNK